MNLFDPLQPASKGRLASYVLACECGRENNYSNKILRDVVVQGLYDNDIQLDLLSDQNKDMELEEVLSFVEKKETGRCSAITLQDSQAAGISKKQKKPTRTSQGTS